MQRKGHCTAMEPFGNMQKDAKQAVPTLEDYYLYVFGESNLTT